MSRLPSAEARTGLVPSVDLPPGWTDARLAVLFHAVFAGVALVVLAVPVGSTGVAVLALVVTYHVALLLTARRPPAQGWTTAWLVLAPLSVLMVLPDWFLSSVLGSLAFADTGAPFVGTVPVFMAGMWVLALFPLVLVAALAEQRLGERAALAVVAAAGLALFWGAEVLAPVVPLWQPVGVPTVGGVAAYVLPAEVLLSVGAWLLVRGTRWRRPGVTAVGVVMLPLVYLGALAVGYQALG